MLKQINFVNFKTIPAFKGTQNPSSKPKDFPDDSFEKSDKSLPVRTKDEIIRYINVCYDKDNKKIEAFLNNKKAMERIYNLITEDKNKQPISGLSRSLTPTEAFDAVDLGLSDQEIEDTILLENEMWQLKQKHIKTPEAVNLYFSDVMILRRFDGLNLQQCAAVFLLEDSVDKDELIAFVKNKEKYMQFISLLNIGKKPIEAYYLSK